MKNKKQRLIISFLLFFSTLTTKAIEVDVDGITYELSGVYATVIHVSNGNTNSTISIPSTITFEGYNYTVNKIGGYCFMNWIAVTNSSRYYDQYENGVKVASEKDKTSPNHVNGYLDYKKMTVAIANSYVKNIILPNTIVQIGSHAFCNTQIKSVEISEGVQTIDDYAFNTPNLESIKLPQSLKSIGNYAFQYSKLKEIIIPASVSSIGKLSFGGCSLLRQIIYLGATPPDYWTATSFTYVPNKIAYGTVKYYIYDSDPSVIEMISFSETNFTYSGKAPTPTWTNNMEGYSVNFEMPALNSEVGSYEVVFAATFTKGEESFTANIPYKYTIEPVKLNATVNSTSRTYGEPNPDFTVSYSGFVNGEDESILIAKPSVSTSANEKSAVGTYPLTISGGEAKNYTLEYEQGELSVNKASLMIQVMDTEKVYGSNNPTFNLGYSGLKNDETVPEWTTVPKFTTTATKESGTGTYEVSVVCEPKNYAITTNNPGKLTIKKAPLTIKANNASMDYCSEMPSYSFTYSGFVNGDTEDALSKKPLIATEATATSNVGTYTITPEGAQANNYDFSYTAGTLTIKQRPLIVKANSATRLYGEENPTFSVEYTGFVNNETKAVLDIEPTISTSATIQSNAGTYDIRVNGGRALNYSFEYQTGRLIISPRALKAFVGNYERPYGEENPSFTIEYEGLAGNDTGASLNTQPLARTSATKASNVGTYPIEVTGGYSPNYTLSYGSGMLTIVKAEQTFTWNQDLTNLKVGDQVELLATASSNLPIAFTADSENFAEIYKAGSKTYMECKKAGSFHIKAVQEGNDNYYSTQRINKEVNIVGGDEYKPTLFIKQADNGTVSTKVNKGSNYRFSILAETGWKIHSVSFNDEDVTSQLDSKNSFTTPAINENSTLSVVYEQENSAVNSPQLSSVKIQATDTGIRVTGTENGDIINIYSLDGSLQKLVRVEGTSTIIPLHKDNVYIVKVGTTTVKLKI